MLRQKFKFEGISCQVQKTVTYIRILHKLPLFHLLPRLTFLEGSLRGVQSGICLQENTSGPLGHLLSEQCQGGKTTGLGVGIALGSNSNFLPRICISLGKFLHFPEPQDSHGKIRTIISPSQDNDQGEVGCIHAC